LKRLTWFLRYAFQTSIFMDSPKRARAAAGLAAIAAAAVFCPKNLFTVLNIIRVVSSVKFFCGYI